MLGRFGPASRVQGTGGEEKRCGGETFPCPDTASASGRRAWQALCRPSPGPVRPEAPTPMSQATILVVDDELGPRESLRMILKPSYEVLTAESGVRALALIQSSRVDVVTLDLKMPGLSGTEVMEAIKGIDPRIEVVIITGYGSLKS